MNSKAIRKQLLAAVAMVLVAAVALGSSTYAWFVANNTVKATTATISAQSNAPFLRIDKEKIDANSLTSITFVEYPNVSKKLYPAQVVKATKGQTYNKKDSSGNITQETVTENTPLFQSAYASKAGEATILDGSRFNVGTPAYAFETEYALHENFKIGTWDRKAGSFKNLKVSKVELVNNTGSDLSSALCVLVQCGSNWAVYKASADGTVLDKYADNTTSALGVNTSGVLAAEIAAASSVDVDIYVFYDGSDGKVYTNNLENLKAIGATISFTATPVGTNGAEGASNSTTDPVSGNGITRTGDELTASEGTSYQWYKDSKIINGATARTYTVTDSTLASYTCDVTTATGTTTNGPIEAKTADPKVTITQNMGTLTASVSDVFGRSVTYVWTATNDSSFSGNAANVTITKNDIYTCTVEIEGGISISDTIDVKNFA